MKPDQHACFLIHARLSTTKTFDEVFKIIKDRCLVKYGGRKRVREQGEVNRVADRMRWTDQVYAKSNRPKKAMEMTGRLR